MKALILKIGAFLLGLFAFYKWGSTAAKLKTAQKEKDEILKNSQKYEDDNNAPYVDNPADFLCYSEDELPEVPKNDKSPKE